MDKSVLTHLSHHTQRANMSSVSTTLTNGVNSPNFCRPVKIPIRYGVGLCKLRDSCPRLDKHWAVEYLVRVDNYQYHSSVYVVFDDV